MTAPIDVLFIHNNFPGQYKLLARHLAADPKFRVFAIGSQTATDIKGVKLQRYRVPSGSAARVHSFARRFEIECRRAEQIIYAANVLRLDGMAPKIIFVHPGWGESLPLRQLFPGSKICVYCEFYYSAKGADVGFDPEFQEYGIDGQTRIQLRNAATLLALVDADVGIAPTAWQRSVFPPEFQSKIRVLHDGIDTKQLAVASPSTYPALPDGLQAGSEILTYVARGLEPYRGFHVFMRALPRILSARQNCQVCIVGSTDVAYGSAPASGATWKDVMLSELSEELDLSRIHFLDRVPHPQLVSLLRASRAYIYLTYPFVLSWSLLEAMALGCRIIASDVEPVREVLTHRQNAMLVPFFDVEALAQTAIRVLQAPSQFDQIAKRASELAHSQFSFSGKIAPLFDDLMATLVPDIANAFSDRVNPADFRKKRHA